MIATLKFSYCKDTTSGPNLNKPGQGYAYPNDVAEYVSVDALPKPFLIKREWGAGRIRWLDDQNGAITIASMARVKKRKKKVFVRKREQTLGEMKRDSFFTGELFELTATDDN